MIDALWNSVRLAAAARSAADPRGSGIDAWEAVVNSMQVGSALFRVAGATEGTVECRIHHEIRRLPAMGPRRFASTPNWLDALWYAIICRDQKRLTELCEVPLDLLQASGAMHEFKELHPNGVLESHKFSARGLFRDRSYFPT
ncbi:immunity 49 family protein [Streptomyces sp. BE133]|uniref:immunity 49 family protein n=1 Tax=Streptomyces sp. BE133 TaxID=3002523 RepID=UPI002E798B9D|nr:immunity 49 family protein [Streptomyces sp. BE133]MEE1811389.1 immunity 49 family protein [Streptomyces sp. BE133]